MPCCTSGVSTTGECTEGLWHCCDGRLNAQMFLCEAPTGCGTATFPVGFQINVNQFPAMGEAPVSTIFTSFCGDAGSRVGLLNAVNGAIQSGVATSVQDRVGTYGVGATLMDASGIPVPGSFGAMAYRDPDGVLWSGYFPGNVKIDGNLTITGDAGMDQSWQVTDSTDLTDFLTLNPQNTATGESYQVTTGTMDMGTGVPYAVGLGVRTITRGLPTSAGVAGFYDVPGNQRAIICSWGTAGHFGLWAAAANQNNAGAFMGGITDGTAAGFLDDSTVQLGYRGADGMIYAARFNGPVYLMPYTVATVPDPAAYPVGTLIYVSNGNSGQQCLACTNGTNWLRIPLSIAITAG